MKKLFLLLAAVCYAVVMQAEVVFHPKAEPTPAQRGFTQDLWEDTETGRVYADQACTQELNAAAVVSYATLRVNPIVGKYRFTAKEQGEYFYTLFDWVGETTYTQSSIGESSVSFRVYGMGVGDARVKWHKHHERAVYEQFVAEVYVNNQLVYSDLDKEEEMDGLYVVPLPDLKYNDEVKFLVYRFDNFNIPESMWGDLILAACLEYTRSDEGQQPLTIKADDKVKFTGGADPELTWRVTQGTVYEDYPLESIMISREEGEAAGSYKISVDKETFGSNPAYDITFVDGTLTIIEGEYHAQAEAHRYQPGYVESCWEDAETHQLYADPYCASPLNAAEVLTYLPLAVGPSVYTSGFEEKESATYSDSNYQLNWLAETSYTNAQTGTRSAEFTVMEKHVEHARLKWYKDFGDFNFGKFTVSVYLNGTQVSTISQQGGETLEGLFAVALPDLEQGDVVKFEVSKPSTANWAGTVTLAACLEYTDATFHAACEPTVRTFGYAQDCMEENTSGKFLDPVTNAELDPAKLITYAKFDVTPFIEGKSFRTGYDVELLGASFTNCVFCNNFVEDGIIPYADLIVNGMDIADARLKWHMRRSMYPFTVNVYVNGSLIQSYELPVDFLNYEQRLVVTPLGELLPSDVVRLEVVPGEGTEAYKNASITASLEYTKADVETHKLVVKADSKVKIIGGVDPALTWTITEGSLFSGDALEDISISREPGEEEGSYAIHVSQPRGANPRYAIHFVNDSLRIFDGEVHLKSVPTLGELGYAQDCVEETATGALYDLTTSVELNPAQTILYTKLPNDPFYDTSGNDGFTLKESATYLGSHFNWVYETTYGADESGIRIVKFKVSGNKARNVRLVWYKNHKHDNQCGAYFHTEVHVNNGVPRWDKHNLRDDANQEDLHAISLSELKNGDIVEFWIEKDEKPCTGPTTLGICLEYNYSAEDVEIGSLGSNITYAWDLNTDDVNITGSGMMYDFSNEFKSPFYKSNIKNVTIGDGIKYIGSNVFSECVKMTSVDIPSGVESIGERAFYYCSSLSSISIPATVTNISDYALQSCRLSDIYVQGAPATVGANTFKGVATDRCLLHVPAAYLQTYKDTPIWNYFTHMVEYNPEEDTFLTGKMGDDVYYEWNVDTGHVRIYGNGAVTLKPLQSTNIKSVTIEDGVTSLVTSSFYNCGYLTSVEMSSTVVEIESNLFNECPKLTSVKLSESLTEIPSYTFLRCPSLKTIDIPSGVTTIGQHAFNNCVALESLSLPEGLIEIPEGMCSECRALTKIDIPSSVTKIGREAFYCCNSLLAIDLPQGITEIPNMMCKDNYSLTSVVIPEGVTKIGDYAFIYAKELQSLTIPASVTSIGYYAIDGSTELSAIHLSGMTPPSVNSCFGQTDKNRCVLYVPVGSAEAYRMADGWKEFKTIVEVDDMVSPTLFLEAKQDPDHKADFYTTFFDSKHEYILDDGATAYTATIAGNELLMEPLADNIIPAGEAVLIKAEMSDVQLSTSQTNAVKAENNDLRGTDADMDAPADTYILTYAQNGLGFYQYAVGKTLSAHKAYLTYSAPQGARGLRMVFSDDEENGIEHVEADAVGILNEIYSIEGVRRNNLQPGLNIVNGRKVIVR